MKGPFRLYPEERHWWSFNDYGAVLEVMQQLRPARVLEFGPGSSTLALIEGGAQHIDTCEDAPDWADVYTERLERKYPDVVRLHRYDWQDPLTIPAIDEETYDLALIDGPLGSNRRPVTVRYAMERCRAVLAPTEDRNPSLRHAIQALAATLGWHIDIRETGPLSGGFALLTKAAPGSVVTIVDPTSTRGQVVIEEGSALQPNTQGDPPPPDDEPGQVDQAPHAHGESVQALPEPSTDAVAPRRPGRHPKRAPRKIGKGKP